MSAPQASAGPGWRAALAVVAAVVLADQAAKEAVLASLEPGERIELVFGIDLVDVSNRGIAFGLLGDGGSLVLVVTIVALAAMLVWFALQPSRPGLWLAVGLLAGGALGNLADRARTDAVTDFIDPPLWPAFNVADIAITFGAAILVLSVFWGERPPAGALGMTAKLPLAYRDGDLAVVDKPAGLVVHGAPGHQGETLVDVLGDLLGGGPDPIRPGIVHRLDKDTSGLMIVARNPEAHRRLSDAIRAREVRREYLALVEGVPRSRSGTIDAPLGRDHRAPERRAVGGRGAREARTHFEVIEVLPADSLLEARLETGRTHQVRAHLAAIGHPVCGDPRYGHAGRHGLKRQFLHSARLGFRHPLSGEEMEFASALPPDLAAALESARVASA